MERDLTCAVCGSCRKIATSLDLNRKLRARWASESTLPVCRNPKEPVDTFCTSGGSSAECEHGRHSMKSCAVFAAASLNFS